MTFSLVKSDPWRKGKPRKRDAWYLWSPAFWKRLCQHELHWALTFGRFEGVSPEGVEMISEVNRKMGITR